MCRSGPCAPPASSRAQLADRPVALGDDLVRVDRLEVHLPREHEVAVVEIGQLVEHALQRDAHGVLDEARLQVRVLDDEELVGPLQQLVDRRAHRRLDELDEPLGVDAVRRADEERALAALVVRRDRDELEDPLDVVLRRSPPRAGAPTPSPRTSPCAHGQALMPIASTPTMRRTLVRDAAAMPMSVTISCVESPVTGVVRSYG